MCSFPGLLRVAEVPPSTPQRHTTTHPPQSTALQQEHQKKKKHQQHTHSNGVMRSVRSALASTPSEDEAVDPGDAKQAEEDGAFEFMRKKTYSEMDELVTEEVRWE